MRIRDTTSVTRALSQVEMLIIVAVVGILSGIGVTAMNHGALTGSRQGKLRSDFTTLNSAAAIYQAFGGNLTGVSQPEEVLARLKSRVSEDQRRMVPGLSGSFVDPHIEFVMQSDKEAQTDMARLYWNEAAGKFQLAYSGGPGIKAVKSNPFAQESDAPLEEERSFALNYSDEAGWIWEYGEGTASAPTGPSSFPTQVVLAAAPIPHTIVPVKQEVLQPPTFSIPGGNYPNFAFDLSLLLIDPNPTGAAQLVYSIDYGGWANFNANVPISVPPNSVIQAQAVPIQSARWSSSRVVDQLYTGVSYSLLPPIIDFSSDTFTNSSPTDTITVTLTDANASGVSDIIYQIVPMPGESGPTTPFQPYTGSFPVSSADYPDGFGVRAYAEATQTGYEDSRVNSKFATDEEGLFGGHLDLDTSTTIASIDGGGSTGAHTHDITSKYGINTINFFAIPETSQININEAIRNPNQKFKLTIVNGNLSPGLSLVMTYTDGTVNRSIDIPVDEYDDTEIGNLTTFSLGGVSGSSRLTSLKITMTQDVIFQAGVIPTNTGDVQDNTLGKQYEWRNGSLTLQAVAVGSSGNDAFTTDLTLSNGDQGAASTGLLWEAALFWHWDGDSYHENGNEFEPGELGSIISNLDDPVAAQAYIAGLKAAELERARAALIKAQKDAEKAVIDEATAQAKASAAKEATVAAEATGDEAIVLAAKEAEKSANDALIRAKDKVVKTAKKVIDKAAELEQLELDHAGDGG